MKTRTKLFLVYLTALGLILILIAVTFVRWFEVQENSVRQTNLQAAYRLSSLVIADYINGYPNLDIDKILSRELETFELPQDSSVIFYSKSGSIYNPYNIPFDNVITAAVKVGDLGILEVVTQKSKAFEPIYQLLMFQLPLFFILVVVVGVIIPFLFYRWIISPIVYLTAVTQKITNGELDLPVVTRSKGVIGRLTKNLDIMRLEIKKRISELTRAKILAEEARRKDDAILAGISDGIFAVNNNGKIFLFNEMAEKITGYSKEEVIGRNYKQVIKLCFEEDLTPNYHFIERALRTGEITKMQNHSVLIGKDVKPVSVEVSASPIKNRNRKITGAIVVFRDVTLERQLENLKDDFFRISSHELKTPMSIIKGYVDMLLDGDAGKLPKRAIDYLNDILPVINRQLNLVDDLLRVSQFESSRILFELTTVNLIDLAKEVVAEVTPVIKEKGLYISLDDSFNRHWPQVQADPEKVRLILNNLLGNSIKFTEKGGISLHVSRDGEQLVIYISDTGCGIPKDMQGYLFRRFSQAGMVLKRKSGGTGLGLFITRLVTQKMGGRAWLEKSELNKGSTFAFSLPIVGSQDAIEAKKQIENEKEARDRLEKLSTRTGSLRLPAKS